MGTMVSERMRMLTTPDAGGRGAERPAREVVPPGVPHASRIVSDPDGRQAGGASLRILPLGSAPRDPARAGRRDPGALRGAGRR
jgi:hypothetical protein